MEMSRTPQLRLIRGGRSVLPGCNTRRWKESLRYTHRATRWVERQSESIGERIVNDAVYYHSERLSSLGWKLPLYQQVQTHHRAITSVHIVDLSLTTRCLGNGQALSLLDVDLDSGEV